ncbi:MAG: glycosyltransferase family 2 protein [Bacteroidota bacterium]
MIRIAGVVVLYNPPENVLENIHSYQEQVETLFVVDNSERQNKVLVNQIQSLGNVVYQWNGDNVGIAQALNKGASLAIEQKFDYLLMMDQDGKVAPNLVNEYSAYLSKYSSTDVGILSPYHIYDNYNSPMESAESKEIFLTITSGTLLNLDAYKKVGPFMDELFIDYVDFEYCLRLHSHGFKVVQLCSILMNHHLGSLVVRRMLFRRVAIYHYPPIRVYYKSRNRLFVARKYHKKYPMWSMKEFSQAGNELVKILCFEEEKIEKCKMAFLGVLHFLKNRLGKLDEPVENVLRNTHSK